MSIEHKLQIARAVKALGAESALQRCAAFAPARDTALIPQWIAAVQSMIERGVDVEDPRNLWMDP